MAYETVEPTYTRRFYHIFLCNYYYINCISVIRHPDDSHSGDRNMLVKNNNLCLDMSVNIHLLASRRSITFFLNITVGQKGSTERRS